MLMHGKPCLIPILYNEPRCELSCDFIFKTHVPDIRFKTHVPDIRPFIHKTHVAAIFLITETSPYKSNPRFAPNIW